MLDRRDETRRAREWADLTLSEFGLDVGQFPVKFNNRMTAARGIAKCSTPGGIRRVQLDFSPGLIERSTREDRDSCYVHEACHGVIWLLHGQIMLGRKKADHHGPAWQNAMRRMGFAPKRCHSVNRAGLGQQTRSISCGRCGTSLGTCTPRKAKQLIEAVLIRMSCCGSQPGSTVKVIRLD